MFHSVRKIRRFRYIFNAVCLLLFAISVFVLWKIAPNATADDVITALVFKTIRNIILPIVLLVNNGLSKHQKELESGEKSENS